MRREIAVRGVRLVAALRVIATAQGRCEGGAGAEGLDRLREDIAVALELLEDRPERTMSARRIRAHSRIRVPPEGDRW